MYIYVRCSEKLSLTLAVPNDAQEQIQVYQASNNQLCPDALLPCKSKKRRLRTKVK